MLLIRASSSATIFKRDAVTNVCEHTVREACRIGPLTYVVGSNSVGIMYSWPKFPALWYPVQSEAVRLVNAPSKET